MENSKSYESYKMLAELLNSEKKENIDKVYDALAAVIQSSYGRKKQESTDAYAKKRDALAINRAKAGKYLDYFMTEKGYSGSGVESDAKLKAELGYGSDLAALSGAEAASAAAIEADMAEALQKNESSRASEYNKAEKETEDTVYKLQKDEADNEIKKEQLQNDKDKLEFERQKLKEQTERSAESDRMKYELEMQKLKDQADSRQKQLETEIYLKEKEYEIKQLQNKAEYEKAVSNSEESKNEVKALNEKINSYRQMLYQNLKDSFDRAQTVEEMQKIYDSVSGANTENSVSVFGEKLYNTMISSFSKALTEAKLKRADEETVQKLYDRFVEAKDEYYYQTYLKLKRELAYSNFPGFNADQLERAYKAYKSNSSIK